jgi:hypothetical protein
LVGVGAFAPVARADGPTNPVATSYLAHVTRVPSGLEPRIVDGDLRIWLRVAPSESVVVLDYRGAPYLRFSRSGVEVNRSSAMYYLNQTPPEAPPSNLGPSPPPRWTPLGSGHEYRWDDGRLNSLARIALAPGTRYVGRWTIPIQLDGRPDTISGSLIYAPSPSIVWFWPIFVLLACVLAARRLGRRELDRRIARLLCLTALVAIGIAGVGQELHGRPTVAVGQLIALGIVLAFVAWGLYRVLFASTGYFYFFVITFAALGEGADLVPTLTHGYVLVAVPAFVVRAATILGLGCGGGLLLLLQRLGARPRRQPAGAGRAPPTGIGGEDDRQARLAPAE